MFEGYATAEGSQMTLIERIDEARTRWNVLDHPFYLRWERGELTRDELAFYAGEYRHAVVALADAAAAAGDPEHAAEEAAHISLWDEFAAALDAPLDRDPTPETRTCAEAWQREDPLEARAVLYAVESGQPDISRTKRNGLVDHYGFTRGSRETEYFELHAERDHDHAEASREVLDQTSPEDADRLVAAAEAALAGNWQLLDGVCGREDSNL
jgi:pyrroloquinoline-quinone synthase